MLSRTEIYHTSHLWNKCLLGSKQEGGKTINNRHKLNSCSSHNYKYNQRLIKTKHTQTRTFYIVDILDSSDGEWLVTFFSCDVWLSNASYDSIILFAFRLFF